MQMRGALGCSLKLRHGKKCWKNHVVHKDSVHWITFSPSPSKSTSEIFISRANLPQFSMYTFFSVSLEFMPRFNDIIFLIVSRYKASCSWWGFQTSSDDHQNRKLDSFTYKNSRHFSSQVRFVFLGKMWIYPWRVACQTFAPVEVLWDRSLSRLPSHLDLFMRIP